MSIVQRLTIRGQASDTGMRVHMIEPSQRQTLMATPSVPSVERAAADRRRADSVESLRRETDRLWFTTSGR